MKVFGFGRSKDQTIVADELEHGITELAKNPRDVGGQKDPGPANGQWKFRMEKVLYDTGAGGYSVAHGESFCDSTNACGRMLAMRWNGAGLNDKDIGFPKNGAAAHWFPIPREFTAVVVNKIRETQEIEECLKNWPPA